MNVQHHSPQNAILQKHIDFYYFLKTDNLDFDATYFAFPNITTPLSIHKNVVADINHYSTSVFGTDRQNNVAIIQGMRRKPLFAKLGGKLDKITIVFKPLGLNCFITKSFAEVCPKDSQFFTEWNENGDYRELLRHFYKSDDQQERIDLLEQFLLSIYRPIENEALLDRSISLLTNFDDEKNVEDIADAIGLSARTFNRAFKESLGISPVGFKKISRFRHSLNNKLFGEHFQRLTDIAYNSNFYDQSYFTTVYREMTGSNPRVLFDKIQRVGADKLLFQFFGDVLFGC